MKAGAEQKTVSALVGALTRKRDEQVKVAMAERGWAVTALREGEPDRAKALKLRATLREEYVRGVECGLYWAEELLAAQSH